MKGILTLTTLPNNMSLKPLALSLQSWCLLQEDILFSFSLLLFNLTTLPSSPHDHMSAFRSFGLHAGFSSEGPFHLKAPSTFKFPTPKYSPQISQFPTAHPAHKPSIHSTKLLRSRWTSSHYNHLTTHLDFQASPICTSVIGSTYT